MYSFIIRGRSLECYKGNSNETLDSIDIFYIYFSQFVLTLFAVVIDSSFTLLLLIL